VDNVNFRSFETAAAFMLWPVKAPVFRLVSSSNKMALNIVFSCLKHNLINENGKAGTFRSLQIQAPKAIPKVRYYYLLKSRKGRRVSACKTRKHYWFKVNSVFL
jgi:hypothetical protein